MRRKHETAEEARKANCRTTWLRDLPRQMDGARRRYHNLILTLKREGMEHLLTLEERKLEVDI